MPCSSWAELHLNSSCKRFSMVVVVSLRQGRETIVWTYGSTEREEKMAGSLHHGGSSHSAPRDYSQTPLNVYWEMTQACALTCRHCRAEAMPGPHPMEMTFEQGVDFMRQIPEFGNPMPQLILTGGDPLERKDLFLLIDEARRLGIGVSITPAATPAFTRDVL